MRLVLATLRRNVAHFAINHHQKALFTKQMRGQVGSRKWDRKINPKIQYFIEDTNDTKQIASVIKQNINNITHAGIFGKAMHKCNELKDWTAVQQIMEEMIQSNVDPDVIEFNVFFKSAAHFDAPDISAEYFDIMIKKYMLIPDVITFSVLIKSCRRRGNVAYAELYWKIMTNKYKIEPDQLLYNELLCVYAKVLEKDKGIKIFNEYLEKVQEGLLPCNMPTFGSYISLLSRCGDTKGMKDALKLFHKYGFELNEIIVGDLMRGYYRAGKNDKCIDLFMYWVSKRNTPSMAIMLMKCCALVGKIKNNVYDFETKEAVYLQLKNTLHKDLESYGLKINLKIALTQLDGAIFLYRFVNPWEIVKEFRDMLKDNLIEYEKYDYKSNAILIDLRMFKPWQAQFIIRYCIGLELDRIFKSSPGGLCIIVGKGVYGGPNNQNKMCEFIVNELQSWNPPIHCDENALCIGRLYIQQVELIPYLNDMNYAKEKLTIQSKDWFDVDVELDDSISVNN